MTRGAPGAAPLPPDVAWGSATARWILLATILGSGLSMLDSTVVNVALPRLGVDLGASLGDLQWVVNGYTLALAALILLGGSLGDRFGRRRVFVVGVVWFAVGSLLCGLSPTVDWLIMARLVQGAGGALLVPGSLAIIETSFLRADRSRAIGAWSALAGVATAAGPLLGGWMVETIGWRWVFLINPPLAVVVVVITLRHVPETSDPNASRSFDVLGASLVAVGLAALTFAMIGAGDGWTLDTIVVGTTGIAALVAFVGVEVRSSHPLLPTDIFRSRQFSAANAVTLLVYAALGALFFLLVVQLQVVADFSPVAAGSALLPITAIMLLLSAAAGRLAERIGPRWPMTVGPVLAGAGSLLLRRIGPGASYATDVLPAMLLIGLGLALTVAPLTATVLAAASDRHAGIASGVNNAVARTGGLLAVASIPLAAGLSGDAYTTAARFDTGFDRAMIICAALFMLGGLLSAIMITAPLSAAHDLGTPAPPAAARFHCGVGAPPLSDRVTARPERPPAAHETLS